MATISDAEYQTRIRQLEALNRKLSEQVDRQGKVVEAAIAWRHRDRLKMYLDAVRVCDKLGDEIDAYERELAELMKDRHNEEEHGYPNFRDGEMPLG